MAVDYVASIELSDLKLTSWSQVYTEACQSSNTADQDQTVQIATFYAFVV